MHRTMKSIIIVYFVLFLNVPMIFGLSKLGKDSIGTFTADRTSDLYGNKYTMTENGTVIDIMVYIRMKQDIKLKGAIYFSSNQSLITSSPITSYTQPGRPAWEDKWFNLTFSHQSNLTAGTEYLLVVWIDYGIYARNSFYDTETLPWFYRSIQDINLPFPDPGGLVQRPLPQTYTIYAEYREIIPPPPPPPPPPLPPPTPTLTTRQILTNCFDNVRSVWMDMFLLNIIIISFVLALGSEQELLPEKIIGLVVSTAVIILALYMVQRLCH